MKKYFFSDGESEFGPLSSKELRRSAVDGAIKPDDFVWRAGSAQRVRAQNISGLFPDKQPSPSPEGQTPQALTVQPQRATLPECEPIAASSGALARNNGDDDPHVANKAKRIARRVGWELCAICSETWLQTLRLVGWGKLIWQRRTADTQAVDMQLALGHKLYQSDYGEVELLRQLAELDEKIESFRAVDNSTNRLENSRQALLIQLAASALDAPSREQPGGVLFQAAAAAQMEQRQRRLDVDDAAASILPLERASRIRVAAGYLTVVVLVLALLPNGTQPDVPYAGGLAQQWQIPPVYPAQGQLRDYAEERRQKREKEKSEARSAAMQAIAGGDKLFAQKEYHRALVAYNSAVESDPDCLEAYFAQAKAHTVLQQYDNAHSAYTKGVSKNRKSHVAYATRAAFVHAHRRKGAKNAIRDYGKAIELQPDIADYYSKRGLCHYDLGDWKSALADFNSTITLQPDLREAFYNRGRTCYELKRYDETIADMSQAVARGVDHVSVWEYRARAHFEKQNYDLAIKDYSTAIERDADSADNVYHRGVAYWQARDHARSAADFTRYIELEPDKWQGYFERGRQLQLLGKLQESIADLDKAISFTPRMKSLAKLFRFRGNLHKSLGNEQAAKDDFSSVQAILNPNSTGLAGVLQEFRSQSQYSAGGGGIDYAARAQQAAAQAGYEARRDYMLEKAGQMGALGIPMYLNSPEYSHQERAAGTRQFQQRLYGR